MKKGTKFIIAGAGLIALSAAFFFWQRGKGKSKYENK